MADDEQGFRPVGDVITLCPMSELHRIGRTLTQPTPLRLFALSLMCQPRPGRLHRETTYPVSSIRESPGTADDMPKTRVFGNIVHRTELLSSRWHTDTSRPATGCPSTPLRIYAVVAVDELIAISRRVLIDDGNI